MEVEVVVMVMEDVEVMVMEEEGGASPIAQG